VLFVRGLAAVPFGVVALVWPRLTVGTLILYFGASALVGGISDVIGSIVNRKEEEYWWLVLLGGPASIVAGVLVFAWPRLTALFLLCIIAARALVTGILDIITEIRLRKEIEGEALSFVGTAGLRTSSGGQILWKTYADSCVWHAAAARASPGALSYRSCSCWAW
jgi:uncharacterized membrane protein HdeD (DUF308 family)